MKRILITGGTGLIGQHLIKKLQNKNFEVAVLSRNPKKANEFLWNLSDNFIDEKALENVTCIIHLAGAGIADKRWTKKRKKEIIESRVASTQLLFKKIIEYNVSLKSFISASGIGFYGAITSSTIFKETDASANDFLGTVCKLWEDIAECQAKEYRSVILRTGIVLAKNGGALVKMKTPIISPIGSGNQYVPWIHIDDLCEMYCNAIEDENVQGVYNAVSPEHQTSKTFSKVLAKSLHRPFMPIGIPAFLLKLIFGEMSVILLKGSRISSQKIEKTRFQFQFRFLKEALKDLVK